MNTAIVPLLACLLGSLGAGPDFDAKVAPLLARRCLDCHSGTDPKGKLDLSRHASAVKGGKGGIAIAPGKLDESLVWEKLEADEMPPKSPLSQEEKAVFKDWIITGAKWGTDPIDPFQVTTPRRAGRDWWSLQPVIRPETPVVRRDDWARTPIDSFVLQKLESNRLDPAPEADKRTLIRRLSFDLTGLPPAPEDIETFLKDNATGAYERLVERSLGSPQYGVRWARWWLDLARYGESNGFEFDEFRPNAWRYRDWVVNSLSHDIPYDEFARLQLAGDVLRPDDPEAVAATGFLVAGAYDSVGQSQLSLAMRAVVRADEMEDIIGTVGQTFLGLTVNCARCHDHKFDPVRQVEYYRLASALGGVGQGERDLSAIAPESIAIKKQLEASTSRLETIEAPVRAGFAAEHKSTATPIASWDFDRGPDDQLGPLKITLEGGATLSAEGLHLDGKTGYAITPPLSRGLAAKTLEAWVKLDRLDQRGGGVISIHTRDQSLFDAIVFGEQRPGEWLAGSNNFTRTKGVGGSVEAELKRPIHVAITYAGDGTIRLFRDGQPHGTPYKSNGPAQFPDGEAQILFGVRHFPANADRLLAGTIVRARLYDRSLTPEEVAASSASHGRFVSPAEIAGALSEPLRKERAGLIATIATLRSSLVRQTHKVHAVTPRKTNPTRIQIRGNPGQPGEVVAPGGVEAVVAPGADFGLTADAPEGERRKRLAGWVADPKNPLFARVVVNRLWQAHFGSGLVETPSDLGFNGGLPSHPELLDWLAAKMVAKGWSMKAMHRLIVNSAVYRQSSRSDPAAMKRDAGDRLLWRKAPVRLEAEMVRDAMLWVSGTLDLKIGGPSYRDHDANKALGTAAILYVERDPGSPGLDRRTLYRAWARGGRSTFLDVFDCPDPSTTAPRRAVTTTPLQALSMMNNPLVLHLADAFAARLVREAGADPSKQVDRAYLLALGRVPDAGERATAVGVVERFGAATLSRALFNSNEFLYVD